VEYSGLQLSASGQTESEYGVSLGGVHTVIFSYNNTSAVLPGDFQNRRALIWKALVKLNGSNEQAVVLRAAR
jgi:hypothetical protein